MDLSHYMTAHFASEILPFIAAGFLAQLIDGALGMAFGVITNTLLVTFIGLSPARASASVHVVEMFTTAASSISHMCHRNIDGKLFLRLAIPGVIGGVAGAFLLSNIDGKVAKPFVMAYLACVGVYLLWRAWEMSHHHEHKAAKVVEPLGLVGGFLDAVGGGGWGPVVTSNLLVQGTEPRKTIGTVNSAEFFVTTAVSATFLYTLGLEAFTIAVVGLIIGGFLAAPLGARLAHRIPAKHLMGMVGTVLVITSLYSIYRALT